MKMRKPRTDPRVHDWLVENAGGWSISEGPSQRPGRPDFDATNLEDVRDAVLARLGVTEAELRRACSTATARRLGASRQLTLPGWVPGHLGMTSGDWVEVLPGPDGSVMLRRAPEVDKAAVRRRIREAGVSARLLGRLFGVPHSSVHHILKGRD